VWVGGGCPGKKRKNFKYLSRGEGGCGHIQFIRAKKGFFLISMPKGQCKIKYYFIVFTCMIQDINEYP
jgi:hypothetical protein